MSLNQAPQRHVNWGSSSKHAAELSYERLAAIRTSAVTLRDSEFIWFHERTHLEEIIERIDATVRLKGERDQCAREKNGAVKDRGSSNQARLRGAATRP